MAVIYTDLTDNELEYVKKEAGSLGLDLKQYVRQRLVSTTKTLQEINGALLCGLDKMLLMYIYIQAPQKNFETGQPEDDHEYPFVIRRLRQLEDNRVPRRFVRKCTLRILPYIFVRKYTLRTPNLLH